MTAELPYAVQLDSRTPNDQDNHLACNVLVQSPAVRFTQFSGRKPSAEVENRGDTDATNENEASRDQVLRMLGESATGKREVSGNLLGLGAATKSLHRNDHQ